MKREFLKGLGIEGLTDEAIEKIMAENGKDIEVTKAKADKSQEIENLQAELKSKDDLLNETKTQIEKFKGMDIEGVQKQADEWKNKYSEFEANAKAEKEAYEKKLADQNYEFAVKDFVGQHKFVNDFVKNAFTEDLKKQGFKLQEDGSLLGVNDYIKGFQEKNQGVFVVETPDNAPKLDISAPTNGGQPQSNGFNFNFSSVRPVPKE
jgi:hypothetical protein